MNSWLQAEISFQDCWFEFILSKVGSFAITWCKIGSVGNNTIDIPSGRFGKLDNSWYNWQIDKTYAI